MRTRARSIRRRAGQAMAEFVVGLIAVLVLVSGILQLAALGQAQTRVTQAATAGAALAAKEDTYLEPAVPPVYLDRVTVGPDGARYTRDDGRILGDAALIHREVLSHARPDEIRAVAGGGNIIAEADADPELVEAFGFVRAHSVGPPVPVLPVVRNLFYRAERIDMDAVVWSVWTQGLY